MDLTTIRASVDALTERTGAAVDKMERGLQIANDNIEQISAVLKRPGFAANDNHQNTGDAKAEKRAISAFIRTGDESGLKEIRAAMSVGGDPDGGYLVLPSYSTQMTKKLFDEVTIRRLARNVNIDTGSTWSEPIDADDVTASWVGEQSARPETTTAGVKELTIQLEELYALQKITQRLIDDSSYDVAGWVEGKITDKFIRSENDAFLVGNGVGKPRGFLTYDSNTTDDATRAWGVIQNIASGAVGAVTADALRDQYWKMRSPYRRNAVWLMSSASANAIDKLKDGQGNYLWRDSSTAGVPPTLLGLTVEFDESMPAIATGSYPIALADWKKAYVVLGRNGNRLLRDNLTAKPHVLFYDYRRVGGGLANSEAIKFMKVQ